MSDHEDAINLLIKEFDALEAMPITNQQYTEHVMSAIGMFISFMAEERIKSSAKFFLVVFDEDDVTTNNLIGNSSIEKTEIAVISAINKWKLDDMPVGGSA